jgi:HAMP domain-containing protein
MIHETMLLGADAYESVLQPLQTADGSQLSMLLQRSLEAARRPLVRLERQIFALSSGALALALLTATFFSRSVTSPLRRLADAARRIEVGDYATPVETARDDETGQLAATPSATALLSRSNESGRDAHSLRRLAILSELRDAAASGQLEIHYQPKVDLRTWRVSHAEALVRWRHPVHGMLPPAEFIPLAEQSAPLPPRGSSAISSRAASVSRSTTTGPATPPWRTSSACRSTSSRSTNPSFGTLLTARRRTA